MVKKSIILTLSIGTLHPTNEPHMLLANAFAPSIPNENPLASTATSFCASTPMSQSTQLSSSSTSSPPSSRSAITTSIYNSNTNDEPSDSDLTDWVIENLENENESITSSDPIRAGEGDTLPQNGLAIAKFRIFAADNSVGIGNNNGSELDVGVGGACDNINKDCVQDDDGLIPIRLLLGRNGWGTGVHPSTRLCLEYLSNAINYGDTLLDYGCGSGILSISALHLGAIHSIGVDVEAESLITAERNIRLNNLHYDENYGTKRFTGLHTREVLPFEVGPPGGVDICVANILVGQLVRPSMVAAIVTNLRVGGKLCLSGIRPGGEVESLKEAYGEWIEWLDEDYGELAAEDTEGAMESFGFDVGVWARLVGRKKGGGDRSIIEEMSDAALM